jgi:hypothetical protein
METKFDNIPYSRNNDPVIVYVLRSTFVILQSLLLFRLKVWRKLSLGLTCVSSPRGTNDVNVSKAITPSLMTNVLAKFGFNVQIIVCYLSIDSLSPQNESPCITEAQETTKP